MKRVTPQLWFDGNADKAVEFYLDVFPQSEIVKTHYHDKKDSGANGEISSIDFRVMGQEFTALNGGSQFNFNPAVSFVVNCASDLEKESIWRKLAEHGKPLEDGWVKDKYGLAWQIVPGAMTNDIANAA